ncbi:helix-turn-helix domain-containing protein [Nocardioides sp.]|uniref:helix-turn-helix domain-containing protein n=1 Tax=Nocardioides sp. TaxID=35761 RepID=UPI002B26ED5D|nr:helix-turn-helix domain-containing protein [Nocardioides sp.]
MWIDYFSLLARDAPAVEFEAPVLTARAGGESPVVIDRLEDGKRLALQLRERLLAQRRREEELTALYDTAYDLARLSDLDSLLEAIVHRARHLLHTDVAYLTLNDHGQSDTYMRVTDGCISARFQRVRLTLGEGLGGQVAQSALPYSTASYFDDERFEHTAAIDGAVAEEGLVAILGVPLQLGSTVIGVLYAANRSERPFARSEVSLLLSLAAHAAAAIDKARLLDETREALAELRDVNLLLQDRTLSVERASAAHDLMAQAVLRGGGVEDIAHALVDVLGGSLLLLDDDGRTLCAVDTMEAPGEKVLERALAASITTGRVVRDKHWFVNAVNVGQQRFAALVVRPARELDEIDQRILERAALVMALVMLSLHTGREAENRVRGELLDDLLRDSGQDPDALLDRARRLGTDLMGPQALFVVELDGADRARATGAIDHVVSRNGGLASVLDGRLVVLLPGLEHEPGTFAQSLADELGSRLGHPVTVGGAGPVRGVGAVATAHAEAVRCVTALRSLGRSGQGASLSELGFVGLVLGDHSDVHGFVSGCLGPLLEYDERRGTDLVKTLQVYFDTGGHLARTKDALHVHVNTVTQRLDRVGKLIGADWQEPARQLELQVALQLHRVSTR